MLLLLVFLTFGFVLSQDESPDKNNLVRTTVKPTRDIHLLNEETAGRASKVDPMFLSGLFDKVMVKYDRKFRPNYGDKPTKVKLELHVLSFSDFDEGAMEFDMDFYFAQFWNDPRFKVDGKHQNPIINLIGKDVEDVWLPDTVFINSKSSKFHDVTVNNRFLSVNFSDGEIVYHARITTKASCRMNLRDYPFDTQRCFLAIESYGHDQTDLVYEWIGLQDGNCSDPRCSQIFVYDKEMSHVDVVEAIKSDQKTDYHAPKFSSATAQFTFQRRTHYFILQIYLPCVLIVMVTWTTFWITPTAVPARSAICVTTILTLITMLGIVNANMPKVSYIKALDMYLFVSFIFVFLSLLEYILVLNFAPKKTPKEDKDLISEKCLLKLRAILEDTLKSTDTYKSNGFHHHAMTEVRSRKHHSDSIEETIVEMEPNESYSDCNLLKKPCRQRTETCSTRTNAKSKKSSVILSTSTTDLVARFLFPIAYGCFNAVYWVTYLRKGN